jgi:thiol:disulfide interchange protein
VGHPAQPGDIKWGGDITWLAYEQGLAEAKRSNKPLCVVVYADWCPRCRELAQAFQNPELEALAKRLVMVRHNADQPGAWLEAPALAQHGKYVPRVFFFNAQGDFAPSITSGHPRYPFFYAANAPLALQQSLQAALRLSS